VRRLTVLHLRDSYEVGGPGKTILETHRGIDSGLFQLHLGVFLTRHESGNSPFVVAARDAGLPVHEIHGYNQYDPRLVRRVVRLVKSLDVDIIHAHEIKSDMLAFAASLLHRVPIITTLHGWIDGGMKRRFLIALDKRIVRRFDLAIAVSNHMYRELVASGMSSERLQLLHNAIAVEKYRRKGLQGFLTELLGKPVAHPVLASLGRLSPEKGHGDLIEALGIVAERGFRVTAVLAGDGPERPRLLEKARALGLGASVHLPGHVSQPDRLLEEVDLMLLPSHTEGLPNAALEALAMEVPVLATGVGGTPEVVRDGVTGRLVAPRSPSLLAAAIIEFLSDPGPWMRMAARGRAMVESEFDFHARTRKLEAIYTRLAEDSIK
jgi:glycosyltransferase involved in cell wall biosynthesis